MLAAGESADRAGRLLHRPPPLRDLDAGVDGPIVWIACPCGARMAWPADEDERAGPTGGHAEGETETMFPEHILTVRATVEPAHEDEFNRWYNEEHIPDVLRLIPGCLGAARYRVLDGDGSHQYMAVYRFASEAALRSALSGSEIKELIRRYDEAIGAFSTRSRTTYTRVFESGT